MSRRIRARRPAIGFRLTYMQGGSFHTTHVPWTHYDLACDYLERYGLSIVDVGEVLINFTEDELRADEVSQ